MIASLVVSYRDAIGVGFVGQRARADERPSTVHVRSCVVVPRVHPANRPPVGRGFVAYGTRSRRHEVHRHESFGPGRHRSQLHLRTDERHDGTTLKQALNRDDYNIAQRLTQYAFFSPKQLSNQDRPDTALSLMLTCAGKPLCALLRAHDRGWRDHDESPQTVRFAWSKSGVITAAELF